MEKKYTPGEWKIVGPYALEEYWIEEFHYNIGPCVGVKTKEDAHLISAAPDLLEALEVFAKEELFNEECSGDNELVHSHFDLTFGDFRRARTALARYRGEA